jgi:hypothetical protein
VRAQDDEYAALTPDAEAWEWYESYGRFRAVLLRHLAGAAEQGRRRREDGRDRGLMLPPEDVHTDVKQQQQEEVPDEAAMAQIRRLRVLVIGCGACFSCAVYVLVVSLVWR